MRASEFYCDYADCETYVGEAMYNSAGFVTVIVEKEQFDFCSFDHVAMWAAQFGAVEQYGRD